VKWNFDHLARAFIALTAVLALCLTGWARADSETDETPPFPGDMSPAGMAALAASGDSSALEGLMPEGMLNAVRQFVQETRVMGVVGRAGRLSVATLAPLNVRANDPTGDAIGETQGEVAVAVFGDTVVIGWNDSKGFLAGNTVSSYAYSTNAGASFVDGGNMPLQAAGDQAFGDPGVDTDEQGHWYYNQIYTKPGQQNIGVHHGGFVGGVLVWNTPVMASIGTGATGALDKCLLACDRVTGNVYTSYTRFTGVSRIEIVRSTTHGTTWDPQIILDATSTPTASKQAARPFCGPNGEVYVVWEKGANLINCPNAMGIVANTTGVIGFARSLNFGVSYDPFTVIGTVDHAWTWSGPGDLRERANDFPDIAVDRSGGPFNGNIYVTWHESAPWTANLTAGPVVAEAANVANNNPGGAELFNVGDNVTGSSSSTADLDYWQFSATQGQNLLFNLDPQGFNCGVTGTTRGLRLRLFATQSPYPNPNGFPDTLLAASSLGAFAQRIVWTCPKTGNYLVRIQPSTTAIGTYTLRVRNLTFGAPSAGRDARDAVLVRSSNQGGSWTPEQRINDNPAGTEERRPFVCVDGLGHVHAFWHDGRLPGLGSNAALTSVFGTTSRDGGVTWTPNYCVTDELSFFSFNTLAIPNLGDYNQAATAGGRFHPAWSDQRISTGDVRVPNTNTYSAGRGPDAYTASLAFDFSVACPADTEICTNGGVVTRRVAVTNTGNLPDQYQWTYNDSQGWSGGPVNGTTAVLDPGASELVAVTTAVPAGCRNPSSSTITFSATPVGALASEAKSCSYVESCPVAMAFDFTPNTLNLKAHGMWVTGFLEPAAPFAASAIDVSSIRLNGTVPVDPGAPTAIGDHDNNGVPDLMVKFNRADAELTLSQGNNVPVTVTGTVDGHCFIGTDEIRVVRAVVSAPAAGSVLMAGSTTQVHWQTPSGVNVQSVALLASLDDGETWSLQAHGLPNSGSTDWTVPSASTDQAKVAVVLVESADETGYIVSGVLGVSEVFSIDGVTGVGTQTPVELALRGVRPNPAKRDLAITFGLPDSRPATLALFDVSGRQRMSRQVGGLGPGWHTVSLSGREALPAGIYLVQLTRDGRKLTTRVAVIP
jgi:hypothetical protein